MVTTLRISVHPVTIIYVQVYVPTSDDAEEEVEELPDKISGRDFHVIMGDWNGRFRTVT